MTLQQKLNDTIITNIYIAESENRMCYDYNHLELAEECEKVADDFAIEFKLWSAKNIDLLLYVNSSNPIEIEKELLEMYKKEKRL
jgi:hypothetical protein